MPRINFLQFRTSRIPAVLGLCEADVPKLLSYCNEAIQRLIPAGGEAGWYGTWQRTVFTVASDDTITLPREIIRIENVSVCESPVQIQNEWFEYLEAGIGPQPGNACACKDPVMRLLDRGFYPTVTDIPSANLVRVYHTDARDIGRRILISGEDTNSAVVRNIDGPTDVDGEFITFASPFATSVAAWSRITGMQKDTTYGDIQVYGVDQTTGVETLLATLNPTEAVPQFRRYYLANKPSYCCQGAALQVQGLSKLEFVPVRRDTDFLLIGCLPALKAECQAIYFEEHHDPAVQRQALTKHSEAIRYLNQERNHYMGAVKPAVNVHIQGTARLSLQSIGTLV